MTPAVLEIEATPNLETTARLLDAGPASESQRDAWEKFQSIPMPVRTDERWRFSNVKTIDLSPYAGVLPVDDAAREELIARSTGLAASGGRMIFANDQLLTHEVTHDALRQKGVIFLPLDQALAQHGDLVRKNFMREEAILGGTKFAALHASQLRTGTFIYVPRGVEISVPIETFHWLHGDGGSCFPHTLIVAEPMSKVTVVDYFESADDNARGFACGVNDLWVGEGAQVNYICTQE